MTAVVPLAETEPQTRAAPQPLTSRHIGIWLAIASTAIAVLWGALINPYWVPSGDGDAYVAVARNLVKADTFARGFTYNGEPFRIAPPGWPLVLSMLIRISAEFWFIKLSMMLMMLGSLVATYLIAIRYVSPRVAAGVIVLTALLQPVYTMVIFTHTEALFCLIGSWMLYFAMRIREGERGRGLVWAILGLGLAASLVRWTGPLHGPLVASILLSFGFWRRPNARWITVGALAAVMGLTLYGTYGGVQWLTRMSTPPYGNVDLSPLTTTQSTQELPPENFEAMAPSLSSEEEGEPMSEQMALRVAEAGHWYSWLLWQPNRFLHVAARKGSVLVHVGDYVALAVGWAVIGLLIYTAAGSARRGDLLPLAVVCYGLALTVLWDNINSRYLVPIAPLILLFVIVALQRLDVRMVRWPRRAVGAIAWVFVGTIALVNGSLWGIEVTVAHADDFYETYEAGANAELIAICDYLRTHATHGENIAVSRRYTNFNSTRYSNFGPRTAVLLTDLRVTVLPDSKTGFDWQNLASVSRYARFARKEDLDFTIFQEESTPWRVQHFKLPASLQAQLSGEPAGEPSGGWKLYHLTSDGIQTRQLHAVEVEKPHAWRPRRVPGFERE